MAIDGYTQKRVTEFGNRDETGMQLEPVLHQKIGGAQ
jgi:hypothetical protein